MSWEFFSEVSEDMNAAFMDKLIALRREYGKPMVITSDLRTYDEEIKAGRSGNSAHVTGRAVDVAVRGSDALELVTLAVRHGMTGIGVSQKGSARFIHIDDLDGEPNQPRPWVWSY